MLIQIEQPVPQENRIVSKIDRMPEPTAFKIETAKKSKEGLNLEVHVLEIQTFQQFRGPGRPVV